tara:strand:+ start:352 stop:687 length:336 start_codon:yes stop_codon:yes gene_type:complete
MDSINDFLGRLDTMDVVGLDHKDLLLERDGHSFRLEHRLQLSQHSLTRIDCVLYLMGIAPDGSRHTIQIWGVEELEPFTRWYWAKYREANDLTYAQGEAKKDALTGVFLAD